TDRGFDRNPGGAPTGGGYGSPGYGQIQPPYPNSQYNQPQEQSYFGNKSSYGQNPHPQEGMHFGRRMAHKSMLLMM
ncbi:hypothetical protein BCR33DRAFT_716250, partial [Rhizoclosmatium globosum]